MTVKVLNRIRTICFRYSTSCVCVCVQPRKNTFPFFLLSLPHLLLFFFFFFFFLIHSFVRSLLLLSSCLLFFFLSFVWKKHPQKKNNPNSSLLCYISRLIVLLSLSFLLWLMKSYVSVVCCFSLLFFLKFFSYVFFLLFVWMWMCVCVWRFLFCMYIFCPHVYSLWIELNWNWEHYLIVRSI